MRVVVVLMLFFQVNAWSQTLETNYRDKRMAVSDSIVLDSVAINSSYFKVANLKGEIISDEAYKVDFENAVLYLDNTIKDDSIKVSYLKYPEFLTKIHYNINPSIIVPSNASVKKYYSFTDETENKLPSIPFDGISSSGSLSRGITVGSNQNAVLNSELDLQIFGKINNKVTLRASIQDANIPLQESGYSQQLDEFDQVFIEMFTDDWQIRGGDIDLIQNNTFFSNFSKRVQGISLLANLNHSNAKTELRAAGAVVRGQFTTSRFNGQEGNQGPYKLKGPEGQLYVLIVSGSETVYVNGIILERGEGKDYIIDYNAGEIIFNATYPITSEMRITVDYQYSERNYTRYNVFGGAAYSSEYFKLGVSFYSESDAKNQPLIQNLSDEQKEILSQAGDDENLMYAPSAVIDSYSENKILYRKVSGGDGTYYEFSNDPNEELYRVSFTLMGPNKGNYRVLDNNAIQVIYEYVSPVNGLPSGSYEPVVKLVPPEKLQIATVNGIYNPSEKTEIKAELAVSKKDFNLFSEIDNDNNDGLATNLAFKQRLLKKKNLGEFNVFGKTDIISDNFNTIQRLYNAEFNRDWNLENPEGDQFLASGGLEYKNNSKSNLIYQFDHLSFSESFNGNKHNLYADLKWDNLALESKSSSLTNSSSIANSEFFRTTNKLNIGFVRKWVGAKFASESNEERLKAKDSLTGLSQRFNSYEIFSGIGDSTKIYLEAGFRYRVNDSVRANRITRVNSSSNYFLKSQLLKSTETNLSLYLNYRQLKYIEERIDDENALNSRLIYNQQFWNQKIQWNTLFETNSGSLPLQDFTYVEVEPGQGKYVWIDYNNNGIQELDEFEIAQFQDQGKFIRVLLPHQTFVKTNQKKWSQTLIINPSQWQSSQNKTQKFLSHFYNQLTYLIDRKNRNNSDQLDFNPFESFGDNELALTESFRNTLFFNRAKQRYTTSYTFLENSSRYFLTTGIQETNNTTHQFNFVHNIKNIWIINLETLNVVNESLNDNFTYRNYNLKEYHFHPKVSLLLDQYIKFDLFYKSVSKENRLGEETLKQNNYGVTFSVNHPKKGAINGTFDYFNNDFNGNSNTPVAYQMLTGLQPGKNFTWSLFAQKKILSYLDLNLNYSGRTTASSPTIHTGSVQLKAYF